MGNEATIVGKWLLILSLSKEIDEIYCLNKQDNTSSMARKIQRKNICFSNGLLLNPLRQYIAQEKENKENTKGEIILQGGLDFTS